MKERDTQTTDMSSKILWY